MGDVIDATARGCDTAVTAAAGVEEDADGTGCPVWLTIEEDGPCTIDAGRLAGMLDRESSRKRMFVICSVASDSSS